MRNQQKKVTSTKLDDNQIAIMAAILGMSNAGADHLFVGPRAEFQPHHAIRLYFDDYLDLTVRSAVYHIGRSMFEDESMANMFVAEADAWVDRVNTYEKAKATRYGAFADALVVARALADLIQSGHSKLDVKQFVDVMVAHLLIKETA